MQDINMFLDKLKAWADGEERLITILLVGSQARGIARVDSDVDLVLITRIPEIYLNETNWMHCFGKVKEIKNEDWGTVKVKRVFYASGLEVEFGITSLQWAKINPVDIGTRRVITDGAKILYDKEGILRQLINAILLDSP